MPVHNKEISRLLNETADLLDIKGSNEFRVRAYRNAARTVEGLPRPAAERNVLFEINAQPERLDLTDALAREAVGGGARIAISTDAHAAAHLSFMRYGVGQARRGWLQAKDVINTRSHSELLKLLKR